MYLCLRWYSVYSSKVVTLMYSVGIGCWSDITSIMSTPMAKMSELVAALGYVSTADVVDSDIHGPVQSPSVLLTCFATIFSSMS